MRVFLDSNVLYSAALKDRTRFLDFWRLEDITPVTSNYAVAEIRRNLKSPADIGRFEQVLGRTQMVSDADIRMIPVHVKLAAKDQPILAAAIAASVNYLATGDKKRFTHLYDTSVSGVRISSPVSFLDMYEDRLLL